MNGFYEYEVPINGSSEMVYFAVVRESSPSPTPTVTPPEGHPYSIPAIVLIAPVIVIAVIGIGLLVHFKKHNKDK